MHPVGKNVFTAEKAEVKITYAAVVEVVVVCWREVVAGMHITVLLVGIVLMIWMDDVKNVGDAKAVFLICVKMGTVPIV